MGFHSQNGALSHYTQPPSIDAPLASDMCDPSLFYFSSSGPYISPFFSLNISRTDTVRQCHLSETLVSHLRPDALSLSALGPHPTIKHFQLKIIKSKKKPSGISLPFPSGGWPFLRRAARLFSKKKVVHKFRIKVSPDVVGNFTERSGTKRYSHWNRNKRPGETRSTLFTNKRLQQQHLLPLNQSLLFQLIEFSRRFKPTNHRLQQSFMMKSKQITRALLEFLPEK